MANIHNQLLAMAAVIKNEIPKDEWDKAVGFLLSELDSMAEDAFDTMLIKVQHRIERRLNNENRHWVPAPIPSVKSDNVYRLSEEGWLTKKFHCEWCDKAPEGVQSAQVVGRCYIHGVGPSLMVWGWLEDINKSEIS